MTKKGIKNILRAFLLTAFASAVYFGVNRFNGYELLAIGGLLGIFHILIDQIKDVPSHED